MGISEAAGIVVLLFCVFQAEDGIRDYKVTGVQTCALPILIDPAAAEVYSNWGRALAQQSKRDEAIARYREALRIAPHSVPHYNWGNALFAAGALEEAIDHYREAARLDPEAAEAYNNWGRALAQLGRWEQAIDQYRQALRIRPNYPLASANLDQALARAGQLPAR